MPSGLIDIPSKTGEIPKDRVLELVHNRHAHHELQSTRIVDMTITLCLQELSWC